MSPYTGRWGRSSLRALPAGSRLYDGKRRGRGLAGVALGLLLALVCCALLGWMALAIYFSPLEPAWLRAAAAAAVPAGALAVLVLVRPLRRVMLIIAAAFALVLAAWLAIPPSNDRDWQEDVAAPPYAVFDGDRVVVYDVRNNDYHTEEDYTVRLQRRTLDLSKVRSLDLFLVYWGSPLIAHTIMSWGFADGQHLAISIETRKEKGEGYSALRGFFRQYEQFYVVADERDVVGLRTNHRGEDVYLYRINAPADGARDLLVAYLHEINGLREQPQWYNALTHNCTTAIQRIAGPFQRRSWWSWKLIVNGYLDELAYDIGAIDRSLSFAELKTRSHINARARAADGDPRFSQKIRDGLPGMSGQSG